MRKLVLGIALLMFAAIGFAAQGPEITPPSSGDEWLRLSSSDKLMWAVGYSQGYQDALEKVEVASGSNQQCASLADRTQRQTSTAGKVSGFELVSGLEKFYSDPANVVIPVGQAIRIYLLQASGKDQATIQELIETARTLGASSASARRTK